jgi:hypothetical protein
LRAELGLELPNEYVVREDERREGNSEEDGKDAGHLGGSGRSWAWGILPRAGIQDQSVPPAGIHVAPPLPNSG